LALLVTAEAPAEFSLATVGSTEAIVFAVALAVVPTAAATVSLLVTTALSSEAPLSPPVCFNGSA
jgi:hypothetical protein